MSAGDPPGDPPDRTPTRPSDGARSAIIDAAWRGSDALDASQLVAGLSLREIASAAGVSPGTVRYHFPTMRELGLAMAEALVSALALDPIDAVEDGLGLLASEGVAVATRAAGQANWDGVCVAEEVEYEARIRRLVVVATGAGPDAAEVRRHLEVGYWGAFRPLLERLLTATLDGSGRQMAQPLTIHDLAVLSGALGAGLLAEWCCHPEQIRPELYADAMVVLTTGSTVPTTRPLSLTEVGAELHRLPASVRERSISSVMTARAAADLFVDGFDQVGFAAVADAAGVDTPLEVLVEAFETVRRVAAVSFSRHVGELADAAGRRSGNHHGLAFADLVHELARRSQSEPWVALALLQERAEAAVRSAGLGGSDDVRALVPLDPLFDEVLATARPDLSDADRGSLACIVVDATLSRAASRPRAALTSITAPILAMVLPS